MIGRRMRSTVGGPTLVVQDIVSNELVACTWINAMGKHRTETFALSGLDDLDAPASGQGTVDGRLGLGSPVMLAAVLQIIGLDAERLQSLLHLPSWLSRS